MYILHKIVYTSFTIYMNIYFYVFVKRSFRICWWFGNTAQRKISMKDAFKIVFWYKGSNRKLNLPLTHMADDCKRNWFVWGKKKCAFGYITFKITLNCWREYKLENCVAVSTEVKCAHIEEFHSEIDTK